jgi:hypothetical protein
MIPDDTLPAPLTADELARLTAFLIERGHRDVAVEVVAKAAYETVMAEVAR